MSLSLRPPIEPMLCRAAARIPPQMAYEPKWDGFRCLVFVDDGQVQLSSRNSRELTRYFPEVVDAVLAEAPQQCVLDGELVVAAGDRLDFERLSERIHPAESRIRMLSASTPASLICWDVLELGSGPVLERPFTERRRLLAEALAGAGDRVHLTPITLDLDQAEDWFSRFEGAGLDGIVAKPLTEPYQPGKRTMTKIKHAREADVVVAGFRLHKNSTEDRPLLGSLQLGLFDDAGVLQFVGVAAAFPEAVRAELALELGRSRLEPGEQHPWAGAVEGRRPGAISRWSTELKETHLISPMLVCEVGYEHMEGTRFRHSARFRRWRPDREPASCTFEQLEEVVGYDLAAVLSGRA